MKLGYKEITRLGNTEIEIDGIYKFTWFDGKPHVLDGRIITIYEDHLIVDASIKFTSRILRLNFSSILNIHPVSHYNGDYTWSRTKYHEPPSY